MTKRSAADVEVLRYPARAVVVVAGLPGAGKTTLLRRLLLSQAPLVLDPQAGYDRYGAVAAGGLGRQLLRPLIHAEHRLRVALALLGRRDLLVHETTRPAFLRWIVALARLRGRSAHLLVLDVDPVTAAVGQQERERQEASAQAMRAHVRRWEALRREQPPVDGFASTLLLSRARANALRELRFEAEGARRY